MSGVLADMSGTFADMSGTLADMSGVLADMSGTFADMSGTFADMSRTLADMEELPLCGNSFRSLRFAQNSGSKSAMRICFGLSRERQHSCRNFSLLSCPMKPVNQASLSCDAE
jgi:hypothetical protein